MSSISPVAPTSHLDSVSAPKAPKVHKPQPAPEKQDSVVLSSAAKVFGDVDNDGDSH